MKYFIVPFVTYTFRILLMLFAIVITILMVIVRFLWTFDVKQFTESMTVKGIDREITTELRRTDVFQDFAGVYYEVDSVIDYIKNGRQKRQDKKYIN